MQMVMVVMGCAPLPLGPLGHSGAKSLLNIEIRPRGARAKVRGIILLRLSTRRAVAGAGTR